MNRFEIYRLFSLLFKETVIQRGNMSSSGTDVGMDVEQNIQNRQKATALHNKLLYTTIAIDFLHSSVQNGLQEQRFRAKCKQYVDDPLSNGAKDAYRLIEILEEKGMIGLGDYDILLDIVTKVHKKIVDEIESTKALLHCYGIPLYRRRGDLVTEERELITDFVHHGRKILILFN